MQECGLGETLKRVQTACAFGEKATRQASQKAPNGVQSHVNRRGIPEDARIGNECEKCVDTRPRHTDRFRARNRRCQYLASALMVWHLETMRVNQQVRVDDNRYISARPARLAPCGAKLSNSPTKKGRPMGDPLLLVAGACFALSRLFRNGFVSVDLLQTNGAATASSGVTP